MFQCLLFASALIPGFSAIAGERAKAPPCNVGVEYQYLRTGDFASIIGSSDNDPDRVAVIEHSEERRAMLHARLAATLTQSSVAR